MNSYRKTAIIAGVLFITATVASIGSTVLAGSILGASDYLIMISASQNQVIMGALFQFIAAVASAGIAISLYPVLKRYDEGLALGSVGFRIIEAVFAIVAALGLLALVTLSQNFVNAGAPSAPYYQTLGTLTKAVIDWASFVFQAIAFALGALLYYYMFYQTKLIPRWLSAWGFLGATLTIVAGLLVLFLLTTPLSTIHVVLNLPIAVQEMVLAVWLIVKGFNLPAIDSLPART